MNKLIALDIDGTLTNSKKEILPKTKEILIELNKQGCGLILASGRPVPGLKSIANELKFDDFGGYLLAFNGSYVGNYQTKEIIYQNTFSRDLGYQVYNLAKKYNLAVLTYKDDDIISEDIDDQYVKVEGKINQMMIKQVDDFKANLPENIIKILITGQPEVLESLVGIFQDTFDSKLAIYRSAPFFIEVNPIGVDKAKSLATLCKHLNIDSSDLIAFGDGYNDLEMIEYAGIGVAMGNAVEEVKDLANYITASNDEEGIYLALKDLLKI